MTTVNIPEDIFFGYYQKVYDSDQSLDEKERLNHTRKTIVEVLRKGLK